MFIVLFLPVLLFSILGFNGENIINVFSYLWKILGFFETWFEVLILKVFGGAIFEYIFFEFFFVSIIYLASSEFTLFPIINFIVY